MIHNEVHILRQVSHMNIVQLIEEYDFKNDLYLVMELVKVSCILNSYLLLFVMITFSEDEFKLTLNVELFLCIKRKKRGGIKAEFFLLICKILIKIISVILSKS